MTATEGHGKQMRGFPGAETREKEVTVNGYDFCFRGGENVLALDCSGDYITL